MRKAFIHIDRPIIPMRPLTGKVVYRGYEYILEPSISTTMLQYDAFKHLREMDEIKGHDSVKFIFV